MICGKSIKDSSVNFSNVGKYKFDTKYEFGEIREMYCSGFSWELYEYTFLFQVLSFFLLLNFHLPRQTTDRLCITITNMDKELYNETAKQYVEGFLELTENPEYFEFETLRSYADL